METTMNELIHFIQKNYKEEYHDEILSKAYSLLGKEKLQIKEHFEKGFLRSKTALLSNQKHYSKVYFDNLTYNTLKEINNDLNPYSPTANWIKP